MKSDFKKSGTYKVDCGLAEASKRPVVRKWLRVPRRQFAEILSAETFLASECLCGCAGDIAVLQAA